MMEYVTISIATPYTPVMCTSSKVLGGDGLTKFSDTGNRTGAGSLWFQPQESPTKKKANLVMEQPLIGAITQTPSSTCSVAAPQITVHMECTWRTVGNKN